MYNGTSNMIKQSLSYQLTDLHILFSFFIWAIHDQYECKEIMRGNVTVGSTVNDQSYRKYQIFIAKFIASQWINWIYS